MVPPKIRPVRIKLLARVVDRRFEIYHAAVSRKRLEPSAAAKQVFSDVCYRLWLRYHTASNLLRRWERYCEKAQVAAKRDKKLQALKRCERRFASQRRRGVQKVRPGGLASDRASKLPTGQPPVSDPPDSPR